MVESGSESSSLFPSGSRQSRRSALLLALVVGIVAIITYWSTCFRTITWWDNSEYSLVAATLGVAHPPGCLLSTLLGWVVAHLPIGGTAIFKLNLFAGLLAALTTALVCWLSINLFQSERSSDQIESGMSLRSVVFGAAALATLSLAFSDTFWSYATKFTPYIFTALLTALILLALFKWWRHAEDAEAFKWLFLITFLLGLDLSVHRTNLLLIPGIFFWVCLRYSRAFSSIRTWRYGLLGLAVGLGIQLLIIPMAARSPVMNFNDPSNWSRFWDYLTVKQYGGGWLISLFPRKAPFWQFQLPEYFRIFADNFASVTGKLGILGLLPALFGGAGLAILFRRNWRLATGMFVLFLLASIGGVLYFNTPANYFRSMDRHYLPSLVIFSIWICYGAATMISWAGSSTQKYRTLLIALLAILTIAAPLRQFITNLAAMDNSANYFAHDFAYNSLCNLPKDAILFTAGDNDTYPLWFLQTAEGFRSDVNVLNINLINTSWYVEQVIARDPSLPLHLTKSEILRLAPRTWRDTTIAVPVVGRAADYQLPPDKILPDSIELHVRPTVAGKYLLVQDQLILQMVSHNHWKRPICFMVTLQPSAISYLSPYLRFEGLSQRIVPYPSSPTNRDLVRNDLLERSLYRGYADSTVPLDQDSRMMGWNYYECLIQLAGAEMETGSDSACREDTKRMLELLPLDRLQPPPEMRQEFDSLCIRAELVH